MEILYTKLIKIVSKLIFKQKHILPKLKKVYTDEEEYEKPFVYEKNNSFFVNFIATMFYDNINQVFIDFLHREKIYDAFCNNLNCDIDVFFKRNFSFGSYIDAAFIWDNTPQGYDFWQEYDLKWIEETSESIKLSIENNEKLFINLIHNDEERARFVKKIKELLLYYCTD